METKKKVVQETINIERIFHGVMTDKVQWLELYFDEQNSEYILAPGHAMSVKILFTVVCLN